MSLYAGRLDGRMFKVLGPLLYPFGEVSAGPAHGTGLTSWVSEGQAAIDLVDTGNGHRTNVATPTGYSAATFDAGGEYVYWTTWEGGESTGLWRRRVAEGPAERVLAGRDVPGAYLNFSLDGNFVAISQPNGEPGAMEVTYDYAVFDARFRLISRQRDSEYGAVVGFLGDKLIVNRHQSDDFAPLPLAALDIHDFSAEELQSTWAYESAVIVPAEDGSPVLLFDGYDDDGRYVLSVLDPDASARVLFVGEAESEWFDASDRLVRRGIEAPGWVAVFPRGLAMTDAALTGSDQGLRRLIRISDGEIVLAPPLDPGP